MGIAVNHAERRIWARCRPRLGKASTSAFLPPLADIQPSILPHTWAPHAGRAPPLAPGQSRFTAQTSRRVSGAIARAVLSPSGKLRRQPRPYWLSNHAVPLAEMRIRQTASSCESLWPHPGLARAEGSSLSQSPFQTERDWHEFLSGRPPHPLQPLLTRNLTPWPMSRCDDAVQQKFSLGPLGHSSRSLRCKIPKPPGRGGC
jgi:hypothetical protein